jgi:hypothetical protein
MLIVSGVRHEMRHDQRERAMSRFIVALLGTALLAAVATACGSLP